MPVPQNADDMAPSEWPSFGEHHGPSPLMALPDTFATEGKCW